MSLPDGRSTPIDFTVRKSILKKIRFGSLQTSTGVTRWYRGAQMGIRRAHLYSW